MHHPFSLELSDLETIDLDFQEILPMTDAEKVGGGLGKATTLALGEEGGYSRPPIYAPPRGLPNFNRDEVTTMALGEEGGYFPYEIECL